MACVRKSNARTHSSSGAATASCSTDNANVRPIISRPLPTAAEISALGDIDPLHARLFAMRGLTTAEQLDYGLAQLAPIGALEHVAEAAELVIANRDKKNRRHRRFRRRRCDQCGTCPALPARVRFCRCRLPRAQSLRVRLWSESRDRARRRQEVTGLADHRRQRSIERSRRRRQRTSSVFRYS